MRKLIELNLAEYQRQTKTMVGDFSNATKMEMEVIKTTTENHAKITTLAVGEITVQLANAESVARQVKCLMDSAPSQWNAIKADTTAQCKQLAQVSDDLRDRFAWRMVLELVIFFLFVSGISILTGHYLWTR